MTTIIAISGFAVLFVLLVVTTLRKARADFFPYSVYAPEGKAIVKEFVAYIMP